MEDVLRSLLAFESNDSNDIRTTFISHYRWIFKIYTRVSSLKNSNLRKCKVDGGARALIFGIAKSNLPD